MCHYGTIKEYFNINSTNDVSPETVWAAQKLVIRGKLLQITAKLREEHKADTIKLTADFRSLSRAHKLKPSPDSLAKLDKARALLNLNLTTTAEKYLRWTGAKFYSQKDRIGSKLAVKLSPKPRSLVFPRVRLQSGDLSHNPTKIMDAFLQYYAELYKPRPPQLGKPQQEFLNSLLLPSLSKEHSDLLESPFSQSEVLDTIKSLKLGSAPGLDGFSTGYYRKFAPTLAPYLSKFFNFLREDSPLGTDLNAAYISLIPKPGKDPSEVGNYRPGGVVWREGALRERAEDPGL